MFKQALYPVEQMNWCIYALFINDEKQIERNCILKTINRTTNLAYSLDGFNKVLGNIDKNYPFSMSPKLILALLVLTGACTIVIGILFTWYKRKTSFTTSTMGNILKLIPSLKEKIPTLDSLLPILSEQAPSQNAKNALTTVAVP